MFCQNCGKQLPDNAKFCGGCGTRVAGAAPTAQQFNASSAPQQNRTRKQPKKKKANFLVIAVVLVAFYFIGKFAGGAIGKSMTDTKETTPPATTQSTIAIEPAVSNPEYDKVFSDRLIVPGIGLFFGLESDSFVRVDDDGIVDHQQFGHKDDLVVEYIETVYIPVEGWTDAEKESYEQNIWDTYGNTGVDCVTLKNVNVGDLYISFMLEYKEMNKTENIRAAVDAGLLVMDSTYSLWGMSATEGSLLAEGYIKK